MLKFAPIMPAFCLLLLYSYYASNFSGKIDASLILLHHAPISMHYIFPRSYAQNDTLLIVQSMTILLE